MPATSRIVAGLAAVVVLATGCNSRLIRPPAIVYADGGEYKVATSVDEQGRSFPAVFTGFVPSQVPLHPRDSLNFEVRDTGEPHTVALGTLVTDALTEADALGLTAELADIEKLKSMRRLPSVLPNVMRSGKAPKLNLSAAKRCFLDEGAPPNARKGGAAACEEREQPEFDGKQSFYSSGLLEDGEPFRVRLSEDIEPGSYRFMCLVHRSQMAGTVEVRPPGSERPTVAELRQQATREEESIESSLEPSARAASADAGPIRAGTGPRGTTRGLISAFIPEVSKAKVGAGVRWTLYGTHSISFSPPREAQEGALLLEGAEVRANPDAWAPISSRPPPDDVYTYPQKQRKFAVAGGSWSGEGAWSSGILRATRPATVSYSMRFSKPGTYAYTCLVHDSMRGKIEVS